MAIRAVFFDLDGTLVNRDSGADGWLNARFGAELTPGKFLSLQDSFRRLSTLHKRDKLNLFENLIWECGLNSGAVGLAADYRDNVWKHCCLFPGVEVLMSRLAKQGLLLGIISNGTVQCQGAKVAGLGLDGLVQLALISEAENIRKPDPKIFCRASTLLELEPDECCVVGDSPQDDIGGGVSAGMATIWIEQPGGWPHDLPFRPTGTVRLIAEVGEWLEHLGEQD